MTPKVVLGCNSATQKGHAMESSTRKSRELELHMIATSLRAVRNLAREYQKATGRDAPSGLSMQEIFASQLGIPAWT